MLDFILLWLLHLGTFGLFSYDLRAILAATIGTLPHAA